MDWHGRRAVMAAGQKGRQQAPNFEPLWERLKGQVDWYDRKAKANQRAYKVSKIAIIVLAILIPVFAEDVMMEGMYDTRALLVGAASGAIVLLEGLQVLNKWQENWILYRATCEGLRNEQHLFAERAGPYAGLKPEVVHRLLAERTSSLVMSEHAKWSHAREHKTETMTGA